MPDLTINFFTRMENMHIIEIIDIKRIVILFLSPQRAKYIDILKLKNVIVTNSLEKHRKQRKPQLKRFCKHVSIFLEGTKMLLFVTPQ